MSIGVINAFEVIQVGYNYSNRQALTLGPGKLPVMYIEY
jgi:hypothetical protein